MRTAHRIVLALLAIVVATMVALRVPWHYWGSVDTTRVIEEIFGVLVVGGLLLAMIPWHKRQG